MLHWFGLFDLCVLVVCLVLLCLLILLTFRVCDFVLFRVTWLNTSLWFVFCGCLCCSLICLCLWVVAMRALGFVCVWIYVVLCVCLYLVV